MKDNDVKKISMRQVTGSVTDSISQHKTIDPVIITEKKVDHRVDLGEALLNRLSRSTDGLNNLYPNGVPSNGKRIKPPKSKINVAESIGGVNNPKSDIPQLKSNLSGLIDGALLTVRTPELQPYDRNPRRDLNERFDDIKNSLRQSGSSTVILEITRRDGEEQFMVAKGGNTRLMALKELWSETLEPKYEEITCIYRQWQGDLVTLAAHWIENNLRGEMTFMDQALEMQTLKQELQQRLGHELSIRKFIEEISKFGVVLSASKVNYMFFAATKLTVLGDQCKKLHQFNTKKIQPLCQQFVKLGADADFSEEAVYEQVINHALRIVAESMRLNENKGEEVAFDIEFFEKTMIQIACDVFDMKVKDIKAYLEADSTQEISYNAKSTATSEAIQSGLTEEPSVKAIEARWTYQDPAKKKIVHIRPAGAGIEANLDPPPVDPGPLLNSETEKQQCQPQQVYSVNPNIIHLLNKYKLMDFFVESNKIPGGAGFYFETKSDMELNKEQASMFWILLMVNQQLNELECLPENSHFRWLHTQASEEEKEFFYTMNLGIEGMLGKAALFDAPYLIQTFLMEPKLLDILDEAQDKSGAKWQVT